MIFFVRALVNVMTRANLQRESERRLRSATGRFQRDIREINIFLRDVNGPRGGIDKQCRVIAKLCRGGTLEIEETRTSFIDAIRHAAKRLRSLLARRIGGKRPRNTLRHAYRRPWSLT